MDMAKTPAPVGWIDTLAQKLNIDHIFKRFNLTTAVVFETLIFFAGGAAAGFLAKRYLKQAIIGALLFVVVLKGLEYFGVMAPSVFDWARIKEITGISPNDTLSIIFKMWVAWMQQHVREVVTAILGFWVGLRLG